MRKIKYLVSALFITVILIFIGEMYVWNIESFETKYIWTRFFLPKDRNQEEMVHDLMQTANKNHCLIFVVENSLQSIHSSKTVVYGMDGVERYIKDHSSIREGDFKSVLMGSSEVRIKPFQEIKDIVNIDEYYLIGTMEDARAFKAELINTYAGNFPKTGYTYLHATRNIIVIWGVGLTFLLLMSLFESTLLKKEMMVRFLYGENLNQILVKKILGDIGFNIGVVVLVGGFLKACLHVQTDYYIGTSLISVFVFLILNSLIFWRLKWVNYKSALVSGKGNKKILAISYGFKVITLAFVTFTAAFCMNMIAEGVDFWSQEDFFKERSEYSYISLMDRNEDGVSKMSLFKEKTKSEQCIIQARMDTGWDTKNDYVYLNKGAIDYLKTVDDQFREYKFREGEIYFIVPENNKNETVQNLNILQDLYKLYGKKGTKAIIIPYEDCIRLIGIEKKDEYDSFIIKNPAIFLDTTKIQNNPDSYVYILQSAMFQISEREWNQQVNNIQVDKRVSFHTNVYENYKFLLKLKQRTMLLGMTTLFLLLFMEFLIIKTTLQFECIFKSTELAIKTVHGYTLLEKYTKMFLAAIVTTTLSAIICIIISLVSGEMQLWNILLGYGLILILDLIITFVNIKKMERVQIQKILKGGLL